MLLLFLRWRPLPTQSANKNLPPPIQGTLRFLFPIAIIEGTLPAAEPLRFLTQWVLKQWDRCIYVTYSTISYVIYRIGHVLSDI